MQCAIVTCSLNGRMRFVSFYMFKISNSLAHIFLIGRKNSGFFVYI